MSSSQFYAYRTCTRILLCVFSFSVFFALSLVPLWQEGDNATDTSRAPYFAHPSTAGTLPSKEFYPPSGSPYTSSPARAKRQPDPQSEFSILADKIIQGLGLPKPVTELPGDINDPTLHPELRELNYKTNPQFRGRVGVDGSSAYGAASPLTQDSSNMARQQAQSVGTSLINAMGEKILSEYGQATFNFRVTEDGSIEGEGDVLIPLYDSDSTTVFTQIGGRTMENDRWIANLGLGQRWFPGDSWTLGYNAFLDYDLTRGHTRGSIGGELWYDWLRFSSNYYMPLSSWKKSRDLDAHQERPAEGWDARVKGYLPWHRNLALTGSYTQWYGDKVGLFGSSKLEANPKVWSYGVEYTPIPLVSGFFDQRRSESGRTDTEVGLRFTYHFAMPFEDQIKPSKVAELRTQQAGRHELVDRENQIILEYREEKFQASLSWYYRKAYPGDTLTQSIQVQSAAAITSVVWEGSAMSYWMDGDYAQCRIKMPATMPDQYDVDASSNSTPTKKISGLIRSLVYPSAAIAAAPSAVPTASYTYKLRAVLRNAAGQTTQTDYAIIELVPDPSKPVDPDPQGYQLTLNATPNTLPGGNNSLLTATLTNNGQAVSGQQIDWSVVSGPGTGNLSAANSNTGGNGQATVNLTALTSGSMTLRATLNSDSSISAETTITITSSASGYSLTASANPSAIANGGSSVITALLHNNGTPASGEQINWSVLSGPGNGTLSVANSNTDGSGQATVTLTGTTIGVVTLRATLASDSSIYQDVVITVTAAAPPYNLNVSATPSSIVNGATSLITATLSSSGNPVSSEQINWSVISGPGSGSLSVANSNTDSSGNATVNLTGTAAGAVTLRATLASDSTIYQDVTITVTTAAPLYNLTASASPSSILNGANSLVTATLTSGGSPVASQQINWSVVSGSGSGSLSVTSSNTNGSGQATVTLTGTAVGAVTLRATLNSDNSVYQDVVVTITPAAPVYSLNLSATPNNIVNGSSSTLTATLTNSGIPVSGQQINWSVVSGPGNGTFNVSSSNTSGSGQATVTFTGTAVGTVSLRATLASDSSIYQNVIITISSPTPVYSLNASASPNSIVNGGNSLITAILTDSGSPAAGQQINWSVVGGSGNGTFNVSNSNTNGSGQATVTFTGTAVGSVTLRAALASDSSVYQDVTITVTAAAPLYSISVSANPGSIVSGSNSLITATLSSGGSPVTGQQVNWSVVGGSGNGTLNVASSNTNGSGQATVSFTGTAAGAVTLRATLNSDNTVYQDVIVTITAAVPLYSIAISASPSTIANGGSSAITATLTDNGTAVSGQQINWSVVGGPGSGTFSASSSSTNGSGQATANLTATGSGNLTLRATLASDSSVYNDVILIINPLYSLSHSTNANIISNGASSILTATLTDNGSPASGKQINWSVVGGSGSGTFSASNASTDGSGQAFVILTGTAHGTLTLRAALDSDSSIYQDVNITITPAAPVYSINIAASPSIIASGGTSTITATLTDSGSPVAVQQINWSVVSATGSGTLSVTSSSTNASGQATVTLTGTGVGSVTLRGTLNSDSSIYQDVTVTITAVAPNYTLSLNASPNSITNGSTSALTATLNNNGSPASGEQVNWSVVSGPGTGTFNVTNSSTDGSGQANVTFTGTGNGAVTLRATLNSDNSVYQDVIVTITAPVPVYSLNLVASPNSIVNGASSTLTATLTDSGTPVSSAQINWTVLSGPGTGTFNVSNSNTDGSGQATVTFTGTGVGSVTLRGTLNSDSSVYQDVTVTITAVAPSYTLSLNASPSSITNGGTSTLTATLNNNGSPASGEQLNWSVVSGPGTGTFNVTNSSTDGSGQANVTFTGTGNGAVTLRATLNSDNSVYQDVIVTITAPVPVYSLNLVASPNSIVNGASSTLTATLTDSGTPVSSAQINWTVLSGPGTGTFNVSNSSTNGSGQATVTFTGTGVGSVTLRGTLNSDSSVYQDVTVTITAPVPVYSLNLVASPNSIVNGATSTLTATLTDSGTPVSSAQINWTVLSGTGSGTFGSPNSSTNGSGQATVTFTGTSVGSVTLRGTLSSDSSVYQDVTVTITAVAPSYTLSLNASPNSITNGGTSALTATLNNNGSPASGEQVNWSVVSGPGTGTFNVTNSSTDSSGQANVTFTGTGNGAVTLRATLNSDNSVYQDVIVTITAPVPVYSINLSASPTTISNGATSTLTAILTDSGSPVSGGQINWTVVSGTGGGTFNAPNSSTDGSGQATVTFTGTSVGSVTLRGTLNSDSSIYQDVTVTITAVAPSYTLSLNASPNSITNGGTSALTATLNNNGSPASGEQVNWSVVSGPGTGTFNVTNSSTDSSGQANVTFTGTGNGAVTLRATLNSDNSVYQDVIVTITAPVPVYSLNLVASPNSIVNGATSTLTATLTDSGTPVSSAQINWTVLSGPGTGTFNVSNSNTDGSGQATVTFTGTGVGSVTLRGTLNSDSSVYQDVTVTITAPVPVYSINLAASPNSIVNGATSTLTATLTDSGSPVSGGQINWTVVSGTGGGTFNAPNSSTDGSGQATATFTATASGTLTVRGTLASDSSVYQDVTITITPAAPLYNLNLSASPNTIANGATSTITATLTDNGTPVSSEQINWTVLSGTGSGTFGSPNSNTDGSGQATVTFTGTSVGSVTLRGTLNSDSSVYQDVTVTITAVAPSYTLSLNASPNSITNGGTSALTATLNNNGSPASGEQVNWSIVSGPGTGTFNVANSSTDGSGQATVTFTGTGTGAVTLRATLDSDNSIYQDVTVTITAPTPVYNLNLSASPSTIVNGATSTLTATLTDSGTPVSGAQIYWTVLSGPGSGTFSSPSSSTDGSGEGTTTLTATTNGTMTVRATLASDSSIFADTTITINAVAPNYSLAFNASPSSIVNGGTSTLTATLTDSGAPVSGAQVNWTIVSGTGTGTFSVPNSNTGGSGQATATFTATGSGTLTLRATLDSDNTVYQEITITITVPVPVYNLNVSASPSTILSGATSTVTATLTDSGNPVATQQINWSVVSGPGNGSLNVTSSTTDGSGQATVTFTGTTSGAVILRATLDSDNSIYQEVTITVTPVIPVYSLNLSASPTSVINGGTSTLTATLTDSGTPATGQQINWSVTSGSGSGTLSVNNSNTDSSGQATVTFTATGNGSVTLRATLGSDNSVYQEVTITVTVPVPVYNLNVSATPSTIANGAASTVTAILTDSGNPVTGQQINWSVVSGPGNGSFNVASSNTDSSGQATVTLTGTAVGAVTLRATLDSDNSVYQDVIINITAPAPVYSLNVSASPSSIINGGSSTLTANLTDNGSPVSGAQINWSVIGGSGSGSLNAANSNTDGSGDATVNLTGTAVGTVTLRATLDSDNSIYQDVIINITAATPVYSLNLSASPTTIVNGTASTLTANLTGSGSPVPGQQINWSVISGPGNGTLNVTSSNTDGSGQATATLTGTVIGTVTLRATLDSDNTVYQEVTITITAPAPVYSLNLSASPTSIVNGAASTLTATLTDSGSPVSGAQINWSVLSGSGSGTFSSPNSSTGGSGQASATFTATGSGTVTLRATLDSDNSVYQEVTITITVPAPVYSLNLSASPTAIANGAASTLTATLTDSGNPVSGAQINWSVLSGSGSGTFSSPNSSTGGSGQASATFTATGSGSVTLRATLDSDSSIYQDVIINITPTYNLTLNSSPNSIANGGNSSLTATLTDNGSPVSGQQLNWSIVSGTGSGSLSSNTSSTNSSGQTSVTLTGTASGTLTLRATLASDNTVYAETNITVTPSYHLSLSAGASNILNGGSSGLTATLTDNGSPMPGQQVNWSVVGGTGNGNLSSGNSGTDGSGQATVNLTGTASGSLTLRATLATDNSVYAETTITITPTYNLTLNSSPNSIANGGNSSLTASLTDNGNPVTGQQVNWSVVSGIGNGTFSSPNSSTNGGGQATVNLTGTISGSLTVRATLDSNNSVYAETTITITPLYSLTLNASPNSITNGGNSSLTATLLDNGNPMPGQQVNWSIISGTGSGTLSFTNSGTDGSGQATVNLSGTASGSLTIRATLAADSSVYTETTITITPIYGLTLNASPSSIINGGSNTLTANLTDNGTAVTGQQINWSVVSGTGSGNFNVTNSNTDGSGQASTTFTGTASGTLNVRATLASDSSVYADATVTITPAYSLTIGSIPGSLANGGSGGLNVILTDNGQPVSGQQLNWTIVTGSGSLNSPSSNTDGSGQAGVTLTATGSGVLTFRASLNSDSSVFIEGTINITPSYSLALSTIPPSINNGSISNLTAILTDNGSVVTGQRINWSIVGGTGSGTLDVSNSDTDGSGQAGAVLTATGSGTLTLRATLAANSSVYTEATITIAPVYALILSSSPASITNGGSSSLTAVLTDGGSAVSGQQINWSIVSGSGNGTLSVNNSNTNSSGQANVNLTATNSGTLILRATLDSDNSIHADTTVTITPLYNLSLSANQTGPTSSTLTALLTDNGSPTAGQQVNWSIVSGNGSLSVPSSSTDGSGQANVGLTVIGSGTLTLRATLDSDSSIYTEITVTITPSYNLSLSAIPVSLINGGSSNLTALLTNNGSVVVGDQINWSISGGTGAGTLASSNSNTNISGQATVALTATASGTLTLRATLASDSSIYAETTITITPAYALSLNASVSSIINGDSSLLTATLTDNGSNVPGQQINWSVVGGLASGTLSAPNSSTGISGQATVNITATASGTLTLRATLASNSSIYAETTITITPAYQLSVSAGLTSIINGGSSVITASLTDNGNLVAGQQINWSVVGDGLSNGSLSVTSSSTNSSGQATVNLTGTASGLLTLRATLASDGSIYAETVINVIPVYNLSLTAGLGIIANGGSTSITALLTDSGSIVAGQQVNWSIVGGTGGGTLNLANSNTDGSGLAGVNLTATASGSVTIRGTLAGNNSIYAEITVIVIPAYSLNLSANLSSIINGNGTILTALLTDNGSVVAGQQVNWSIVGGTGGGSLNLSNSNTNGSGQADVNLTATASGTLTLRATLAANSSIYAETTITILPSYHLTISGGLSTLLNGGNGSLSAVLTDNGHVVSGQQINWSVVSGTGSGSLNLSSSNTNGSGQANVNLTATVSGTLTLRATLAGDVNVYAETTIIITPAYSLSLNANQSSILNGGVNTLTATLTDNGVLVNGQQINWSIVSGSGSGTLNLSNSNTNSSGQASVNLTALVSGNLILRATLASDSNVFAQTTVSILPVYNLGLSASLPIISNGGSSILTALLTDTGNLISGQQINWSIISGNGTLSVNNSNTNSSGQANVNLTATASGTITVRATLAANSSIHVDTTIIVTPLYQLHLSASPTGATSSALTATLTDNGSIVAGQQVNWSIISGNGSLNTSSSTTNSSGQANANLSAHASGTLTIRATLAGNISIYADTTVTITPSYGISLNANPVSILNGNSSLLTATLTDNGSAMAGQQINWSITSGTGSGTLGAPNSTTGLTGQAAVSVTGTSSGTLTLRATMAGNPSVYAETTITITPSYAISISASPTLITNGGNSGLTATLTDNGTLVNGQQINWSIVSGTGNGTLSVTNSNTNSSGQATTNLTATASGVLTLRASLASNSSIHADTIITITPAYNLTLGASLAVINNGGSSVLTAVLFDNGNLVPGQQINWSVVSGTGTLNVTSSNTNSIGQATTTLTGTVSGNVRVRATLASNSSIFVETTVVVLPVLNLTVNASLATIPNGGSSILTATLTDNNSPLNGQQINWSIVAGGTGNGTLNVNNSNTNVLGQATTTLTGTVSGTVTLRATLASNPSIFVQTTITVTPVFSLNLVPSSTNIVNGGTSILTATLTDHGNLVAGQQINWSVVSGPGGGTLSVTNSTTNVSGQTTTTLTATASGTLTLRATLASNPSISAQITITITPVYTLTVSASPTSIGNGSSSILTAVLRDNGSVVSGQQINWSVLSSIGNGTFSATSSNTNGSGQATSTLTATRSGTLTLRATLAGNPTIFADTTITITPTYILTITPPAIINLRLGDPITLTATLTDNGTPISGQTINWNISGLGVALFSNNSANTTTTTGANGQVSVTLRGITIGLISVKATMSTNAAVTDSVGLLLVSIL